MSQNLRIAVPFSLAAILTAVIAWMAFTEAQPEPADGPFSTREEKGPGSAPTRPLAKEEIPRSSPTAVRRRPVRKPARKPGGFSRWDLSNLPANWNGELAQSIHSYFEMLDVYEKGRTANAASRLMKGREDLRNFLAGLGPESLETLATILNSEPDFVYRRFMLVAIGDLGPKTEGATWALRDYFVSRSPDPQNRSEMGHLIKAMGQLQNNTSFDVMQDLIKTPGYSPYRDKFIWELGEHNRRDEAVDFFNAGLSSETSKTNRNRYAQALGKIARSDSLSVLYDAFNKETYWVTKQTILGSIGKIGNPNSIPFLEEHARYATESAVRLSAARALSRVGTPLAMETLRDVAQSESDRKTQSYMIDWSKERQ